MRQAIIDGANMNSQAQAHQELASALEFPEYYGGNLDALWDMISTMEAEVTMIHAADMLNALGVYGCKLMQTLFEAQSDRFVFRVE